MHRKICSSMKIYESMCGEAKSMHKSFGPLSREVPLVVEASVVSAVAPTLRLLHTRQKWKKDRYNEDISCCLH